MSSHFQIPKIPSSEITPQGLYLSRRSFLKSVGWWRAPRRAPLSSLPVARNRLVSPAPVPAVLVRRRRSATGCRRDR